MCILLVEDEAPVRATVAEALTDQGFEVCEVETSDQAASLIEKSPVSFRLLITNVDLPGRRNGFGLARLAHQIAPSLPVIYITGRPDQVEPIGSGECLLVKPFTFDRMLQAVRDLLRHALQIPSGLS